MIKMSDSLFPPGRKAPVPRDRRNVTIMFADVVGSTALIEQMDPEHASSVLSSAVETAVALVDRFGGTLNKRLGDGLMATFGAPTKL